MFPISLLCLPAAAVQALIPPTIEAHPPQWETTTSYWKGLITLLSYRTLTNYATPTYIASRLADKVSAKSSSGESAILQLHTVDHAMHIYTM